MAIDSNVAHADMLRPESLRSRIERLATEASSTIAATEGVETKDEGVQVLAKATSLDFVGAGVTVTDGGSGVATVTIPGGGGSGTRIYAEYTLNSGSMIGAGGFQIVDFDDVVEDDESTVTTGASWKFTCPADGDGDYLVCFNLVYDNPGQLAVSSAIYKNGSLYRRGAYHDANAVGNPYDAAIGFSWIVPLVESDYIDVRVFQNTSTANNTTNAFDNWIQIRKLN